MREISLEHAGTLRKRMQYYTGLNLQTLGSLINLDLPWNPTTLEQRKSRVQRGTIEKRIPFCNLRYDEGVEQRLSMC